MKKFVPIALVCALVIAVIAALAIMDSDPDADVPYGGSGDDRRGTYETVSPDVDRPAAMYDESGSNPTDREALDAYDRDEGTTLRPTDSAPTLTPETIPDPVVPE